MASWRCGDHRAGGPGTLLPWPSEGLARTFVIMAGLGMVQITDSQDHILDGHRDGDRRLAWRGSWRHHQYAPRLQPCDRGTWTAIWCSVEIGVEAAAHQRGGFHRFALDQDRSKAWMPSRCSVGAEVQPDSRITFSSGCPSCQSEVDQFLGDLTVAAMRRSSSWYKGFEQLERHLLGQPHSLSSSLGPPPTTERPKSIMPCRR